MMDIEAQFNLIAQEYDSNRRRFIPCFDDFYEASTDFIAFGHKKIGRILDLGAGTGLLSAFWYKHYPKAKYVLVDIADKMLDIARKRFAGLINVSYQILDYSKCLPQGEFDTIISALSIHHLADEDKAKLFAQIYDKLPDGGWFVNYDQFCAGEIEINPWFDAYWEDKLYTSGLTAQDIFKWQERRKLDKECSVEEEMAMLRAYPFKAVQCVYAQQKFAVIVAVK